MNTRTDERPPAPSSVSALPLATLFGLPARAETETMVVGQLLQQVLDALAHGLVLVDSQVEVLHANPAARLLTPPGAPMALIGGRVQLADAAYEPQLLAAVRQARQGQWSMLSLGQGSQTPAVGVVPMVADASCPRAAAMLVLGSASDLSGLALQFFCQEHQLTPREGRVLAGLRDGLTPEEVAAGHGVAMCTVRTQIQSIRQKVGEPSIRLLMRRLMALPAMMVANPGRRGLPWR